jgi:hypothetical protein
LREIVFGIIFTVTFTIPFSLHFLSPRKDVVGTQFQPRSQLRPPLIPTPSSSSSIHDRITMSDFPLKAVTAVSAISSYILVGHYPGALLFSRPSYLGTFVQAFTLSFLWWCFWKIILYPKFFSPLRYLPKPEGGSWWNGHFAQISALPSGTPMIEW